MLTTDTLQRLGLALTSDAAATEMELLLTAGYAGGTDYYVDAFLGANVYDGKAPARAKATLAAALALVATGDRIWIRGDIREEALICSNLVFDVKIIGVGGIHHPDQPSSAYDPGSACIRPPASPTASTPLLEVRGRGWQFHNIMFDCPVDAAAIYLLNNNGSGLTEYDASHAVISGCTFQQGKYAIQANGPSSNVRISNCDFAILSETGGCAIFSATNGGPPYRWRIVDNIFAAAATAEGNKGNQSHIDMGLMSSLIKGNVFGTVESTGLYIDLTGGQDNVVTQNTCMGTWATADYKGGTGDSWVGNYTAVDASTSPVGFSIAVPD